MEFKRRVAIVESDKFFLESYAHIVNSSDQYLVVGSYSLLDDLRRELIQKKIEIALMNIDALGEEGVEEMQHIKDKYPHLAIVIVSANRDKEYVINSLRAGASGYIEKSPNFVEIIYALDQLVRGGAPISSNIAKIVIQHFHLNPNSPLTRREKGTLKLMAEGKTYTQISSALGISPETVRTYIRKIYSKFKVSSKSEAIKIGMDNKYI